MDQHNGDFVYLLSFIQCLHTGKLHANQLRYTFEVYFSQVNSFHSSCVYLICRSGSDDQKHPRFLRIQNISLFPVYNPSSFFCVAGGLALQIKQAAAAAAATVAIVLA